MVAATSPAKCPNDSAGKMVYPGIACLMISDVDFIDPSDIFVIQHAVSMIEMTRWVTTVGHRANWDHGKP